MFMVPEFRVGIRVLGVASSRRTGVPRVSRVRFDILWEPPGSEAKASFGFPVALPVYITAIMGGEVRGLVGTEGGGGGGH